MVRYQVKQQKENKTMITNTNIIALKDEELDKVQGGSVVAVVGAITLGAACTVTATAIVAGIVSQCRFLWKAYKRSK